MAPEIIDDNRRPFVIREDGMKKSDIWSIGNHNNIIQETNHK